MILLVFGFLVGSLTVQQVKYDKCKAVNFNTEVCKVEKCLDSFKK